MASKVCSKCKVEKSLDEYYVAPRNRDGKMGKCKACVLERKYERRGYPKKEPTNRNRYEDDKLIIESKHGIFTILYDKEDEDIVKTHTWTVRLDRKPEGKRKTAEGLEKKTRYYVNTQIPHPDGGMIKRFDKRTGKYTTRRRRKAESMHRMVMGRDGIPKGMVVDHINGNGLDNRKENLRVCTHAQNVANSNVYISSKSGYKGVGYNKPGSRKYNLVKCWKAYCADGFSKGEGYIGMFLTKEIAAYARDLKALEVHGQYAVLNFPDGPPEKVRLGYLQDQKEKAARKQQIKENKIKKAEAKERARIRKKNKFSKYIGVVINGSIGRADDGKIYRAQCCKNGKQVVIGSFHDEVKAAKAYDAFVINELGGVDAFGNLKPLNFPDEKNKEKKYESG